VKVDITIDTRQAQAMLERLANRTRGRGAMDGPLQRAAQAGAGMISGVPSDTGALAGSIRAGGRRGPGLIVSDLEYARFALAEHPPSVPAEAIAQILAENVAREVFG
jgi:hypothetical protein